MCGRCIHARRQVVYKRSLATFTIHFVCSELEEKGVKGGERYQVLLSRLQAPRTTKVFTIGPHKPLILLVNCFSLLYSPAKALLLLFLLRAGREWCEVTYGPRH